MTRKQNGPPEHTKWKKGISGNPGGRPKLPPELKAVKELTGEELKRLFAKYARMTEVECASALEVEETPMVERVIASGLMRAVKDGDYGRLNFILDRTIGKVADKTEIKMPEPVMIQRRDGVEIVLTATSTSPVAIEGRKE